jgi:hypothetical protein
MKMKNIIIIQIAWKETFLCLQFSLFEPILHRDMNKLRRRKMSSFLDELERVGLVDGVGLELG